MKFERMKTITNSSGNMIFQREKVNKTNIFYAIHTSEKKKKKKELLIATLIFFILSTSVNLNLS